LPHTRTDAATAIGDADSAFTIGQSALFVVNNGTSSAVYSFVAANADATVDAGELTLLAVLQNAASTVTGDYLFSNP
jgi:hypothetical protein